MAYGAPIAPANAPRGGAFRRFVGAVVFGLGWVSFAGIAAALAIENHPALERWAVRRAQTALEIPSGVPGAVAQDDDLLDGGAQQVGEAARIRIVRSALRVSAARNHRFADHADPPGKARDGLGVTRGGGVGAVDRIAARTLRPGRRPENDDSHPGCHGG